jgi:uncharacterized membrane protein
VNPFALPVHPAVVHIPLAMLVAAWVCWIVRYATGDAIWTTRAWTFEVVGAVGLPLSIVAALIDTRGLGFLSPPRWDAPLVWHAIAGLTATLVFGGHALWRWRRPQSELGAASELSLTTAGVWLLVLTGLLGGELVFAT